MQVTVVNRNPHVDCKNALYRGWPRTNAQVCCWITQLATQLLANNDMAFHAERPAQHLCRPFQVSFSQCTADSRAGNPFYPQVDRSWCVYFKSKFFTEGAQLRHVAFTTVPETKVLAHYHATGRQAFNQHLRDKLAWGQSSKRSIKSQHPGPINASGTQLQQLLVNSGQPSRRRLGFEYGLRQRLKGNYRNRFLFVCQFHAAPKQGTVAQVYAIEIPYGHDRTNPAIVVGLARPVAQDFHVLYRTLLQVMLAQTAAKHHCKINHGTADNEIGKHANPHMRTGR